MNAFRASFARKRYSGEAANIRSQVLSKHDFAKEPKAAFEASSNAAGAVKMFNPLVETSKASHSSKADFTFYR